MIASPEPSHDSPKDLDPVRVEAVPSDGEVLEPAGDLHDADAQRDASLEESAGRAEASSLPLSPTFRFFVHFWRTGRTLDDTLSAKLGRDHGLDLRDYLVLNSIFKGRRYPTELADHLQIGKDIVSRIVNKLMHEGLIDRSIDTLDSRRTRLEVSPAGLERRDAIKTTIEHTIAPLLELLGADRRDAMTDSLESFNQLLLERLDPATAHTHVDSVRQDATDEPNTRDSRNGGTEAPRPNDLA